MAEHDSDREGREPDERDVPFDEEAAWAAIVAGYGEEPPDPPGTKPFKPVEDLALPEAVRNPAPRSEPTGSEPTGSEPSGSEPSVGGAETDAGEKAESAGSAEAVERGAGAEPEDGPGPSRPPSEPTPPAGAARPPLGSSISFAPGVGPRDYSVRESSEDDFDEDDEGHFVPPEPPPLPSGDTTARFAWLAVVGGPVLLLLAVLLGWDMTWWLTTLGIGGFLGGFVTLVARMNPDDGDDDDPGRGAVV